MRRAYVYIYVYTRARAAGYLSLFDRGFAVGTTRCMLRRKTGSTRAERERRGPEEREREGEIGVRCSPRVSFGRREELAVYREKASWRFFERPFNVVSIRGWSRRRYRVRSMGGEGFARYFLGSDRAVI